MVEDQLHLSSDGGQTSVTASFGCQTHESGLFYSQVADGIAGFSGSVAYGPTFLDRVVSGLKTPNIFSMCLSEEVGAMVMGGSVPASLNPTWIPLTHARSYVVDIADFQVGGVSVGGSSSQYHETIIDSGTTFTYLPPAPYRKPASPGHEA